VCSLILELAGIFETGLLVKIVPNKEFLISFKISCPKGSENFSNNPNFEVSFIDEVIL
jgi:hypothetical protein